MALELEKAQIMWKLSRKNNWGKCYDRLEHFKRFQNLNLCVKELLKVRWLIIYNKPNYNAISLNPNYKKEIINFIEEQMPYIKGVLK